MSSTPPPAMLDAAGCVRASVFVCGSFGDARTLEEVAATLRGEGLSVQVLAGIDEQPFALAHAIDRASNPALFVVCKGASLDRSAIRRVAGLFSARKGPEHRLVNVSLAPHCRRALVETVLAGSKDVVRDRGGAPALSGERVPLRDVVGDVVASDAKRPRAPKSAPTEGGSLTDVQTELMARKLHRELRRTEALLHRRKAHREAAQAVERAQRSAASSERAASSDPVPPSSQGLPIEDRHATERVIELRDDDTSELLATGASRPSLQRSVSAAWLIAAGGVLALGFIALARPPSRPEAPSLPQHDRLSSSEPGSSAPRALPDVVGLPGSIDRHPEADRRSTLPTSHTPMSEAIPPAPKPGQEIEILQAAVDRGDLTAAAGLFVLDRSDERMPWELALEDCRHRRVGGVKGFRLPTMAELRRLQAAGVLRPATYWAQTSGQSDDEAHALDVMVDGGGGSDVVYLKAESVGRPLCVRGRELRLQP